MLFLEVEPNSKEPKELIKPKLTNMPIFSLEMEQKQVSASVLSNKLSDYVLKHSYYFSGTTVKAHIPEYHRTRYTCVFSRVRYILDVSIAAYIIWRTL